LAAASAGAGVRVVRRADDQQDAAHPQTLRFLQWRCHRGVASIAAWTEGTWRTHPMISRR
jgi:hypothetical protein